MSEVTFHIWQGKGLLFNRCLWDKYSAIWGKKGNRTPTLQHAHSQFQMGEILKYEEEILKTFGREYLLNNVEDSGVGKVFLTELVNLEG